MSKIREIYQMEKRLRMRSPRKHLAVKSAHAKTFAHLDRRGGACAPMPKSPALARKVDELHAQLSRNRNPRSARGVTISQTVGLLMLEYVNEHDPDVSAFEVIAAEAASDPRGTRVPVSLAVKARAEVRRMMDLQTDPMAREELEGFLDNLDFAIQKARHGNPSSTKSMVKRVRASKAKKAASRSASARKVAGKVRSTRVKSALKALEKNPSKSSMAMYVGMIPSLSDAEIKKEKAAVKRRMKAVQERDRGPNKGFRLAQLQKMYDALEDERLGRIAPNPVAKMRRKGKKVSAYAFTEDDIRLVEKYKLENRLKNLEPDQIESLIQRVRVEEIAGQRVADSRKSISERAKEMRARRKSPPKKPIRKGYKAIKEKIVDTEAFDIPDEYYDPRKTKVYRKVQKDVIDDGKTKRFSRMSNPLKGVTERTPEKRFRQVVSDNTRAEINIGKSPEQAYAIALSLARKQAPKKAKKLYGTYRANPSARGIEVLDFSNKKHYVVRVPTSGKAKIVAGPFRQPARAAEYIEKKSSQELYDVSTGEIIPLDAKGGALLDIPMDDRDVREMKSVGVTWEEFFEGASLGAVAREYPGAKPNPRGRKKKGKKRGRRRWGAGARAAAGGAVGGLALGLPGAAAGAYVGATRELRKKNPYRGDDHTTELKRVWMKWHDATKELESAVKRGTVPQIQSAIRKVIKKRDDVERLTGSYMSQPDVIEGVPRRAFDARVKKEAKALHDKAYESFLADIQKLTFREDRPFRDPRPVKPKRRGLFGRRNPEEKFKHHGKKADLAKKGGAQSWGEYESSKEMYRGKIPPDPRKKNPVGARELVAECRRLWGHYCERPGKTRLRAVLKHCEKMAESTAKSVKEERARCMRSARREMKKLGMK